MHVIQVLILFMNLLCLLFDRIKYYLFTGVPHRGLWHTAHQRQTEFRPCRSSLQTKYLIESYTYCGVSDK